MLVAYKTICRNLFGPNFMPLIYYTFMHVKLRQRFENQKCELILTIFAGPIGSGCFCIVDFLNVSFHTFVIENQVCLIYVFICIFLVRRSINILLKIQMKKKKSLMISRDEFRILSNFYDGAYCENS